MKPGVKPQDSGVEELFRAKLKNIINMRHALMRLGELINGGQGKYASKSTPVMCFDFQTTVNCISTLRPQCLWQRKFGNSISVQTEAMLPMEEGVTSVQEPVKT